MTRRPNILLIYSDQHRWNAMGCGGNPQIRTPNLDRLAAEGTQFTHAVSTSPLCSPARACLQTSRYPHEHEVIKNGLDIRTDLVNLADRFNDAGYATGYIGKAHWTSADRPGFIPPEMRLGWRHWRGFNNGHFHYDTPDFDAEGRPTHRHRGRFEGDVQLGQVQDFILDQGDAPWLVQWNINLPHPATLIDLYARPETRAHMHEVNYRYELNYPPELIDDPHRKNFAGDFPQQFVHRLLPKHFMELYDPAALWIEPNVPEHLRTAACYTAREYYAMITCMDDMIGRMVDFLEDRGLLRETIVIYTSDHGEMQGTAGWLRWKTWPYQNACRVPLIAWGPGRVAAGRKVDAVTGTIDLMPTLLELIGEAPDDSLRGLSQARRLCEEGAADDPRAEYAFLGLYAWRGVFDGRYLFSMQHDGERLAPFRLFDTERDPYDVYDLKDEAEYAGEVERLTAALHAHLESVGDEAWRQFPWQDV